MARKKKSKAKKSRARRSKKSAKRRVKKASKKAHRRGKKHAKKARRRSKKGARKAHRRGKKHSKKAHRRSKAKKAPARRRRRSGKGASKRLSSAAMKYAKAMGMVKGARRNPGGILGFLQGEAKDMMEMAPSIAVQLGAMAAVGYASSMASEQIRKRVAPGGAVDKFAGVISSGVLSIAAFAAMKMVKSDKVQKFALPVLMGGMAATAVQALAAIKVKKDAADVSLGQRLGLPIGDYMAMSGYLDVHGRQVAIDGFGEYVDQPLGALDIHPSRFAEGAVVSVGEYVDQPLGALSIDRTIEGSVLGEIGQMSEGRQGARALNSPGDPRIESFINRGSLSGSVFD
jgi:hypothetical protein